MREQSHETSASGHDYIAGLQRDPAGQFYAASSNQGLIRIDPNRKRCHGPGDRVPATLTALGLSPDGVLTVPCSEGDWTPPSMVCEIRRGLLRLRWAEEGGSPDLPLVYLPRGLDNSSGGQVTVPTTAEVRSRARSPPVARGGTRISSCFASRVRGQPQGAIVRSPAISCRGPSPSSSARTASSTSPA